MGWYLSIKRLICTAAVLACFQMLSASYSLASPLLEVVAYKAGDVYHFDSPDPTDGGTQINYQDVLVGVKLDTSYLNWGIIPEDYGYDYFVPTDVRISWFAQPQGNTEQVLTTYATSQHFSGDNGDTLPSEIFLFSLYSVMEDGGNFQFGGTIGACFELYGVKHPLDYDGGDPSVYILESTLLNQPELSTFNIDSSSPVSISLNVEIPAYYSGTSSGGNLPIFSQVLLDNILQGNNLSTVDGNVFSFNVPEIVPAPVPEPTSLILLGFGLGVIALTAWRRRKFQFKVSRII